jgi:hypothetical protein
MLPACENLRRGSLRSTRIHMTLLMGVEGKPSKPAPGQRRTAAKGERGRYAEFRIVRGPGDRSRI